MTIYKCFKSDFENLSKKINHITKKLDKYNLKWTFEVIGESVEDVKVIDYRNLDNIPLWQFTPKHCGTIAVEIVSYTFEMESLQLGKYEVLAIIDHNAIQDSDENIIHVLIENAEIPLQYRTVKSICEHCNSNRTRNKTVLLRDAEGQIIQVGTSCIKEYTGIDALDIIKNYQEINDICITEVSCDYEKSSNYPKYDKTLEYLAACIQLIKTVGYSKDENPTKYRAWEITGTEKQEEKYLSIAQTIIDYFKSKEFLERDSFYQNIKNYLSEEYVRINGFVAYAYIAYNKLLEIDEKKQAEASNKKESSYIGNIGEKIEKELTLKKCIAYETMYGISKIYLFEDAEGNIFKWNTTNSIAPNEGEHLKIKGTIKAQEEYNEEKQTVLTRCKII